MRKLLSDNKAFVLLALFLVFYAGATNYDRIVLGSANYGQDPNTTADITLQNDEYVSNYVNGQISFGAANLLTTGTIGAGVATFTSLAATALSGNLNANSKDISSVDTLSGANGETISNTVNGQWSFGSANLLTTGTLGSGAITCTSIGAFNLTGNVTPTDSSKSVLMKDSAGKKWRIKVRPTGTIYADSTGLN